MAKRPRGARLGHDGRDIAMLVGPDGAALLALMYPGTNVRSEFHVDHVFPRSRFKPTTLAELGMAPDLIREIDRR